MSSASRFGSYKLILLGCVAVVIIRVLTRAPSSPTAESVSIAPFAAPLDSVSRAASFPGFWRCPAPLNKTAEHKFYGQGREDRAVYELLFKSPLKVGGTYLELGGLDGISKSNTKFFEDFLDWRGVMLEASPVNAAKLRVNRPLTATFAGAACEKEGVVEIVGESAIAGIKDFMGSKLSKSNEHAKLFPKVRCFTLGSVLRTVGVTSIDFWSLDVEGAELAVLKGMDWSIPVHYILVETMGKSQDFYDQIAAFLSTQGFRISPMSRKLKDFCLPPPMGCPTNTLFENPAFVDQPLCTPAFKAVASTFGEVCAC